MKKIIAFIIVLLIVVGVYYFWPKKEKKVEQGPPPKVKVITYTVVPGQLVVNLETVGTLLATESTTIRSEVAGKIEAMPMLEGQAVKKGDLLIQIDDMDYQQEVERKKADFELAQLTYERNAKLVQAGATTQQIKDESNAAMMIKKAAYETAKIQLERTRIVAPYDGILGVTNISLGEYLPIGTAIINISAINPILAQFPISQNYFSRIKLEEPITLTVDSWPGKKFKGSIYAIDPQIDVETRTVPVKAEVPNKKSLLRPGMFAHISMPVEVKENTLLVPEEALIPSADQMTVLKVVDGKAQIAKITTGIRQNSMVEVTSGLEEGDVIISSGQLKVQEGMPVEAINPETSESPPA